jgi:hypothetical protein
MAGTTVRIAPKEKERKLIQAHIDILRGYASKGFESKEDLQKVLQFITSTDLKTKFSAHIGVPFERVNITHVLRIIVQQISILEDDLETASS